MSTVQYSRLVIKGGAEYNKRIQALDQEHAPTKMTPAKAAEGGFELPSMVKDHSADGIFAMRQEEAIREQEERDRDELLAKKAMASQRRLTASGRDRNSSLAQRARGGASRILSSVRSGRSRSVVPEDRQSLRPTAGVHFSERVDSSDSRSSRTSFVSERAGEQDGPPASALKKPPKLSPVLSVGPQFWGESEAGSTVDEEEVPPTEEGLVAQFASFEQNGRLIPERVRHSTCVERGERQSVLRRILGAIAYDLADMFGFQKTHTLPPTVSGEAERPVLSSVANQVENLVSLLSNRMDACEGKPFALALYEATSGLHTKVFANYEKWVQRLQLLPREGAPVAGMTMDDGIPYLSLGSYNVTLGDFASLEEGYAWVQNAQLQRLTLYSLLHGEAANLRHLPECLCYVFYSMSHSLMLVDTRECYDATGVDFPEVQMCLEEHRPAHAGGSDPFGPEDYLERIVDPIYRFIEHEVSKRKDDPVPSRVMYDDVTECFWQRSMIDLLLPIAPPGLGDDETARYQALHAYNHLRELLREPESAASELVEEGLLRPEAATLAPGQHPLRAFFGKTYLEKPGWYHCFHVYHRVLVWHAIFFHATLVVVFFGSGWQELNVVCITHATGKILRQLTDIGIGHPPRSVHSKVFGFSKSSSQSLTEHITLILLYSLVPTTYAFERSFRRHGLTTIYDMISTVYVVTFVGSYLVHTKPGYRIRSLWRTRHAQHIGSEEQLSVPIGNFVTYCLFWAIVLTSKLAFDYTFIITPLKEPILGLLGYPFPRLMWSSCTSAPDGSVLQFSISESDASGLCVVFEPALRYMLVALRMSVPMLVFLFDTYIFFSCSLAIFSSLVALRRKIGVVSHWRHVVMHLQQNVHDFNTKLLGTHSGDSARAARAQALHGKPDWCVEARSLEWQNYARAWNSLVVSLRDGDALSNIERDELLFGWISGGEADDFFELPEYVIFPTFVTSPVLSIRTSAVSLQQAARAAARGSQDHAYGSFARTMQQTRDLLLWLLVRVGIVPIEKRADVLEAITRLAALDSKHLLHRHGYQERAFRMCKLIANFIDVVHQGLQKESLAVAICNSNEKDAALAAVAPNKVFIELADATSTVLEDQAGGVEQCAVEQKESPQARHRKMASELTLHTRNLLRKMKQLLFDGFDARSVASAKTGYNDCVEAWDALQKMIQPDEMQVQRSWATATSSPPAMQVTVHVIGALHRSFWSTNPGGDPSNAEAKRQLLFFCNSLFNTTLSKPPPVSRMKSWSSFTPHYAEDVTYSMAALREEKEGVNGTLLNLLTSLFTEEWHNFCERIGVLPSTSKLPQHLEPELQLWASDRAQVLSRTVRGVMRYGEALRVLARLEGVCEDQIEMLIASKFEFIVTCQIYGKLKAAKPGSDDAWKAEAIDQLRQQYAHNLRVAYVDGSPDKGFYSLLLVVEPDSGKDRVLFKVRLPGNPIVGEGKPENQNHAIIFTRGEHVQTLDMNQDNYMGESYKMRNLLECFKGRVRIVGFREHIFSESGGAVAGFAASNEFVFGTMVQRFLTWPLMVRFHYGHPDVWDKVWAFSNGGISKASKTLHVSEDIFAGFNTVLRGGDVEYLEYIHCGKGRDMGFTAVNGFEMKISAGNALQCTSRDVYRLGKHFDLFRLFSFYFSGSGFYIITMLTVNAVYCFALAQLVLALCGAELFEFNYEIVEDAKSVLDEHSGHRRQLQNLGTPQLTGAIHPHLLGALGNTLDSPAAVEEETDTTPPSFATASGSIYSAAYVLQLGFTMMLPYAMELWVETSLWRAIMGTLRMVFALSPVFSLFTMQTKGFHFSNAISFGRAGYVATGRGFQMDTLALIELYAKYAESHIVQGFEMLLYTAFFWFVTQQNVAVVAIASFNVLLVVVALMLSPWIFNPGALTVSAVAASWRDWRLWIDSESTAKTGPNFKMADGNWKDWHKKRMSSPRGAKTLQKIGIVVQIAIPRLIVIFGCVASLRSSNVLAKADPAFTLMATFTGAFVLAAFGISHYVVEQILDKLIERARLIKPLSKRGLLPQKRGMARFTFTQLSRLALVAALLDWQGLVAERRKRRKRLDELADAENKIIQAILLERRPRGQSTAEIKEALPGIRGEVIDEALLRLRTGIFPLLTAKWTISKAANYRAIAHVLLEYTGRSLRQAMSGSGEEVYTIRQRLPLRRRVRSCVMSIAVITQRTLTGAAATLGGVADFYYRLFDLVVALALFLLLALLTMLPLHEAQSILLFNANFKRVIQRGMRTSDFLESLWA